MTWHTDGDYGYLSESVIQSVSERKGVEEMLLI